MRGETNSVALEGKPMIATDPWLVGAALAWLVAYEVISRLGGFVAIRSLIVNRRLRRALSGEADPTLRVCTAVAKACSLYPRTVKCLQRSSVTAYLLRAHGVQARLVFGVQRFPFYAHAWVEVDGQVVNDRKVATLYQAIAEL
jgi:hypothetical protein